MQLGFRPPPPHTQWDPKSYIRAVGISQPGRQGTWLWPTTSPADYVSIPLPNGCAPPHQQPPPHTHVSPGIANCTCGHAHQHLSTTGLGTGHTCMLVAYREVCLQGLRFSARLQVLGRAYFLTPKIGTNETNHHTNLLTPLRYLFTVTVSDPLGGTSTTGARQRPNLLATSTVSLTGVNQPSRAGT